MTRFEYDDDGTPDMTPAGLAPGTGDTGDTGDTLIRSEEEPNAGAERVRRSRVGVRERVVTEQEELTVPVQRDELRVERRPIIDAGQPDPGSSDHDR
jgi:stress response protein YsnF